MDVNFDGDGNGDLAARSLTTGKRNRFSKQPK
jgi:hypothetical protein